MSPALPITAPQLPAGFNQAQHTFCLAYLANGFNATAAYRVAYPKSSVAAAMVSGWRLLRVPKIASWLKARTDDGWKALQMGGEEALARTALLITFDVRQLFNAKGQLKPVSDWPEEAGQLVESIELNAGKVRLPSRMAALRTILEQTGKLKTLAGGIDELAAALRADLEAHGGGGSE